jgi:hypothetical protein
MVTSLGTVKVRTNVYSVPLPAGTRVQAKILPATIELWHEGKCVAQHDRCYGRQQEILDLEHYLDVLERKPGALAGSKPLDQWRTLGRWPASYDRFWEGLMARSGRQAGTREMIELLQLGRVQGQDRLRAAIERALALGCHDAAAVRHLMSAKDLERDQPVVLDIGRLVAFERPQPQVREYDQLLAGGVR